MLSTYRSWSQSDMPCHVGGICAAADNKVQCFRLGPASTLLAVLATLEVKQQGIADICIRADHRLFATAGWDGKVRVFHHKKMRPLAILQVAMCDRCVHSPKEHLAVPEHSDWTLPLPVMSRSCWHSCNAQVCTQHVLLCHCWHHCLFSLCILFTLNLPLRLPLL